MPAFTKRLPTVAFVAMASACAGEDAYVPQTGVTAPMGVRVAAEYGIPPEAPRGDLRIASYGRVEVTSQGDPEQHLHALHLRVIVHNSADKAWTFDTREQRVDLEGHGQSAPAFASASPGAPPPMVTIRPSGKRVIDLFFPLPADLQDADELPSFDAVWRVSTGEQVVSEGTPFERLTAEPEEYATYDYGDGYYWGPPYWYNPLYPAFGFVGAVAIAPGFVGHPVMVRYTPGGHFAPRGGGGDHR